MKINWKVRLKNKAFWLTVIPALLLLASQVLELFGVQWDPGELSGQLTAIVGTLFGIAAVVGVVTDPTTKGLSDSEQAMTYQQPKE